MGNGELRDLMIHDGLWCAFDNCHMGLSGETVAATYHVTREEQDAYAAESHRRAAAATAAGWFADEILPVTIPQKKGPPIVIDRDEPIRADTTAEGLAKLKPAFKADGTVTAGNAPGVNDGAAALVVMAAERARALGRAPLARIVGQATSGLRPGLVMMTPVPAVRRLLEKIGWSIDSVDLFELNEAFSVQAGRRPARAGHRRLAGERERRRRGARSRHRRQRRPRADHTPLCDAAPERQARRGDTLPRRRQRRRTGGREGLARGQRQAPGHAPSR